MEKEGGEKKEISLSLPMDLLYSEFPLDSRQVQSLSHAASPLGGWYDNKNWMDSEERRRLDRLL